jgi:hypothetical protein
MRHLSFRIILLSMVLPPVFYLLTVQGMQAALERHWQGELQGLLTADVSGLLEGRVSLSDEIERNIARYFRDNFLLRLGVIPRITVKTETGRLLYPQMRTEPTFSFDTEPVEPEHGSLPTTIDLLKLAEENLRLMKEGIALAVAVEIPANTVLANGVLCFYLAVFGSLLYWVYRQRAREAKGIDQRSKQAMEDVSAQLRQAHERLAALGDLESQYNREMGELRAALTSTAEKLRATEEEALEEIGALEEKLRDNVALQQEMDNHIAELQGEVQRLESSRKITARKRSKLVEDATNRFRALYKNLKFDARALEGFLDLEKDFQIKAEEIIHALNEDESRLSVKRKVFSGKGTATVFECDFAYRGRIYWRRNSDGKLEVLAVGTKNTQERDLAYLASIARN